MMKYKDILKKDPQNYARKSEWFNFQNLADDTTRVNIYDEISSYWGMGGKEFAESLSGVKTSKIELHIDSPGGSVHEGINIYNNLKSHPAEVVVKVDGWAASIAAIIMLAGDQVEVAKTSMVMIHDAWGVAVGTAEDMLKQAELLETLNTQIAEVITSKTGQSMDQVRNWMQAETWFTGDQAVQNGFADSVFNAGVESVENVYNAADYGYVNGPIAPEYVDNSGMKRQMMLKNNMRDYGIKRRLYE